MAQYAIQGYAVNALDYVLKPINYFSFRMKLLKAWRVLQERPGASETLALTFPQKGTYCTVKYGGSGRGTLVDSLLLGH